MLIGQTQKERRGEEGRKVVYGKAQAEGRSERGRDNGRRGGKVKIEVEKIRIGKGKVQTGKPQETPKDSWWTDY